MKPRPPPKPYQSTLDLEEYEEKEESLTIPRPRRPDEYVEREVERPRTIEVERRTIHKMITEKGLEPLKRVSPKVIGNLFDRVGFLKQRMVEIKNALDHRKTLHNDLVKEIIEDIQDKEKMLTKLSDVDDIRDFKLDISTLKMERRRENVQYWRDILELSTELRELLEEYQMESKIANLFKELQPGE